MWNMLRKIISGKSEFNWENLVVYQDSYAHDTVL